MWPFEWFRKSAPAPVRRAFVPARGGHPVFAAARSPRYLAQLAASNSVASAAVARIVANVAGVAFKVAADAAVDLRYRAHVNKLLARPNDQIESGSEFFSLAAEHLAVYGECFVASRKWPNADIRATVVQELRLLEPPSVEVLTSQYGDQVSGYAATEGGQRREFKLNEVNHLKLSRLGGGLRGTPPLQSAIQAIEIFNLIGAHSAAVARQGGVPSCILELAYSNENDRMIGEDQLAELHEHLKKFATGGEREGTISVVNVPIKIHQMPQAADSISFEQKNAAADEIAYSLGVPPILLRSGEGATYQNQREARISLWTSVVRPRYVSQIEAALSELFGCKIAADYSLVHAELERQSLHYTMVNQAGFLSVNEKRAALGYPPIKGGGEILTTPGSIPLSALAADDSGEPAIEDEGEIVNDWINVERTDRLFDGLNGSIRKLNGGCSHG